MNAAAPAEDGIRQAINYYIEGLREGSVETLKEGFHAQALMSGHLGETMMIVPIQGLYDFVAANPAPALSGEPFEASIVSIDVSGSAASARIAEKSYQGHDFATFFHLLKIEDRWWIVSKIFNVDAGN